MAGIVFYPNYFRWFDRATHEFLREVGLPFDLLIHHYHFATPLIDVGCRFYAPLRYNDAIRQETSLVELRVKSFKLEHLLYKGENLVGKGHEVHGWCIWDDNMEPDKLQAVPIPPEMAEKLKS
jgi:acyl-CoA thioester hydrolase